MATRISNQRNSGVAIARVSCIVRKLRIINIEISTPMTYHVPDGRLDLPLLYQLACHIFKATVHDLKRPNEGNESNICDTRMNLDSTLYYISLIKVTFVIHALNILVEVHPHFISLPSLYVYIDHYRMMIGRPSSSVVL